MRFLLSSLLLASLCALSSRSVSSSGTLVVTQSPDVSVMEGETVSISCCWRGELERERMWVVWLKNQTDIKKEIFNLKEQPQVSLHKKTPDCTDLTFTNITREDSGRYTCRITVEIPVISKFEGNDTSITVTAREYDYMEDDYQRGLTTNPLPLSIIIPLAVVTPLLVVALACFCIQRKKQAQAARVIYEAPHVDSEVADMDKHSTSSSRGSSQWCQVPVYESFDYFERVQTKESG